MAIWHNDLKQLRSIPKTVEAFTQVMAGAADLNQALKAVSKLVAGRVEEMVNLSQQRGIQAYIGTIPPFSSRLAYCLERGDFYAQSQQASLPLIEMTNERLHKLGGINIVDVHKAVVNPVTGLMKPEFSWGEERQIEDTLHLSSAGQVMVGVILCSKLFQVPTRAILPDGGELKWL